MTNAQSVFAAFLIILIDLIGRAGLDKVLALQYGSEAIALWAQLQTVTELISSITITGVLTGLTVNLAQVPAVNEQALLLRSALKLSLITSVGVALLIVCASPVLSTLLSQDKIPAVLFLLAAIVGCISIFPATLNAYWLGKHQQRAMLKLAFIMSFSLWVVTICAWLKLSLNTLMLALVIMIGLISVFIFRYIYRILKPVRAQSINKKLYSKLMGFIPVGMAIGMLSPLSMLLIRSMLSKTLSWQEVGVLQALWRSTEWVTAMAAGIFYLIFLPRFSHTFGTVHFKLEMKRASAIVLVPTTALLLTAYYNQHSLLAALYNNGFAVSDTTAKWYMLGCWLRIASWLFLFGLFAAHRTRLIIAGELFSFPFYGLLLWVFSDGMTLERSAVLFCISYLVYLVFNAGALKFAAYYSQASDP